MPSLIEIGLLVLEKKIFKIFYSFVITDYLPLEMGNPLHLNYLESSPPQGYFVPSLVKIVPVVLEKEVEIVKVYRQRAIRIAHLSFQLR
jgi:hypothetical protein